MKRKRFRRIIKNFIRGYGSVINLIPRTDDEDAIRKDIKAIANDFWFVIDETISKEGKNGERKFQTR